MRRVSKKRQQLMDEVDPLRSAYRDEHPICQRPGCSQCGNGIHELSTGQRAQAYADICTWLNLCSHCHLDHCHGEPLEFPIQRQLAWKFLNDRENFCLSRALALDGKPNANIELYAVDVMDWLVRELQDQGGYRNGIPSGS